MGIVNITPDSFYDGSRYFDAPAAIAHAKQFFEEGVDIVDIGGQSTRPASQPVGAQEELSRVLPVLKELRKESRIWISIDTYRSEVARICLAEGADMINDVSSFRMDPEMPALIASERVPVVCMHFLQSLHPMPANPEYKDLFGDILSFFEDTLSMATAAGVSRDQIVLDPGIGFGKKLEHNLRILNGLKFLQPLDRPILVGPSRKSFIAGITGLPPEERLEGTAAAVAASVIHGAQIVRVHDVLFFRRFCDVLDAILQN